MNLAKTYLETAYQDLRFTAGHMTKLERAGELEWTKALLRTYEARRAGFAPTGSSPIEAARHMEEKEIATLLEWRDQLAGKVGNPRLKEVELVFVELSSPQALAIHEQDDSYAIAFDRRMLAFLGSVANWAYVAAGLELRGMPAVDARSVFLQSLADHVQVAYLNAVLPPTFELRELQLAQQLGELEWRILSDVSRLAAKFVLLHELAHVHLGHFQAGTASPAGGQTAEVSAFHEQQLEFQADRFAQEHLMDGENTITAAVLSKVAGPIYFYILSLKEAMLPATAGDAGTMVRVHPPGPERAERLKSGLDPRESSAFETVLAVPELLRLVYESAPFQAAARFFASRVSSGSTGR